MGHAIGVWMHLASQKRVPLPCLLLRISPQRLGWIVYHSLSLIAVVSGQLLLCGWHVPPCLSFAVDTVCETFVWCSASGIFVSSPDLWSVCPGQIKFGLVLPRVGGFGSLLHVPLCLHCYCGWESLRPIWKICQLSQGNNDTPLWH